MRFHKKDFWKQYLPKWEIIPLLTILALNCVVYWGSGAMTADRYHYDLTLGFDRKVPLMPAFVWIYILAYLFWAVGYILPGQRGKDTFYRFVATDLTVHLMCFLLFLLIPTTNVRPELAGGTLSEKVLQLVYDLDGGSSPSNLFPSIHCYVSWLCWRGIAGAKEIPKGYQRFSLVFAVLVIISTQVLKQHYIVDAIAGVALVELAWHFYRKKSRYQGVENFFEKLNRSTADKR